ncbi:MAG: hypothetical protein H0W72_11040 [Planctomycetes bacterium]|nr:hypothetical protein [Planctomycetota bacterium]
MNAAGDNPFARPEHDHPARGNDGDPRRGVIAGWIFLIFGVLSLLNMAWGLMHSQMRLDLGAVAMVIIGRGLLTRSDSARRWGIGCAGTYAAMIAIAIAVFVWLNRSADGVRASGSFSFGSLTVVLGILVAFLAVFLLQLWLLLDARTRDAYALGGNEQQRRAARLEQQALRRRKIRGPPP